MKKDKKDNFIFLLISLIVVLFFLMVLALLIGKYKVSAKDVLGVIINAITFKDQTADPMTVNVILNLRLPRVLASIIVGASLSISGAVYQGIFKNPLVSPDFLGVSSGASVGASIAILLGFNSILISSFSFIGGIVSVLITCTIPMLIKNRSNIVLVLSGIIVSSLMSSILGFLKYTADPNSELASITYWMMGDFSYISSENLLRVLFILIPPIVILLLMSYSIDVLSMGETEARYLGEDVRLVKAISIISATLLTAGSICISGTIGWVGLIIPHFSRMLVGSSNRKVLPVSLVIGGIFMLFVDSLTRIVGVSEMPVSIMTGIIGAPFFFYLMFKRKDEII